MPTGGGTGAAGCLSGGDEKQRGGGAGAARGRLERALADDPGPGVRGGGGNEDKGAMKEATLATCT